MLNYHAINTSVQQAILKPALDAKESAASTQDQSSEATTSQEQGEKSAVSTLSQEEATKALK